MSGEAPLSDNDPRLRNDWRLGTAQPEDGSRPRCSNVAAVPGNPTFHMVAVAQGRVMYCDSRWSFSALRHDLKNPSTVLHAQ